MLPVFLDNSNGNQYHFKLSLSPNLPDINAHFPNHILVPAYMQLAWMDEAIKSISPTFKIIEFKAVKFIKEILPTWEIELVISLKKLNEYKFTISHLEEKLTSGEFIINK